MQVTEGAKKPVENFSSAGFFFRQNSLLMSSEF
jgi:hypothetical protein